MSIRIRRLRIADYSAVIELLDLVDLHPRVRGRDSRTAFAKQLRSNRTLYFGAFDGGRLVGTVFGTHDTRKGWINRLSVHPDYRGRGIARRLVRECERGFRSQGIGIFAALIERENEASLDVFRKLGYDATDIVYVRRKIRENI